MTAPAEEIRALDARSKYLRSLIVDALEGGGRGHVGSSLSLVELIRVLYDDVLKVNPKDPLWAERDRFILSKGHGCLALYVVLADAGFFALQHLREQCRPDALLGGHPEANIPGVEAATGALGHGLSLGVGMALAARNSGSASRVFVVMGDGELDEGSVWEAALSASKHRLVNLTALVDYNKLQCYGEVREVLNLEPLADKWRAFGFEVREVDGHDVVALRRELGSLPFSNSKPGILICHTTKGFGMDFAHANPSWHHKSKLNDADITRLRQALEAAP